MNLGSGCWWLLVAFGGGPSSASLLNLAAQDLCQRSTSMSVSVGNTWAGKSGGKASPVSGCLKSQFLTAYCMNGTCSSGPSKISSDSQREKPRMVRAGIVGGAKSSWVGWSVCWQPVACQIKEREA